MNNIYDKNEDIEEIWPNFKLQSINLKDQTIPLSFTY